MICKDGSVLSHINPFGLLNHHHHHDVRLARISLTLSLHVSQSFIASVSSHSCCMNARAGRPAFDWLYAGVHRSTSLTISSLFLQQCPACLVRQACIVFVIGGRWPYSWRRVGCCCQDLFNIARIIATNQNSFLSVRVLGLLSSSLLFFSLRFGGCIHRPSLGVPCLSGDYYKKFLWNDFYQ